MFNSHSFLRLPFLICLGWVAIPLCIVFAQQAEGPRPSVTPEEVDANYDPLRNRKVNRIIMIRDIKREDAARPMSPTEIPPGAEVTELDPRSAPRPPETTVPETTLPPQTEPRPSPPPPIPAPRPTQVAQPTPTPQVTVPPSPAPRTPPSPRIPETESAPTAPTIAEIPTPPPPPSAPTTPVPPLPSTPSVATTTEPELNPEVVAILEEDPALQDPLLPQNAIANRIDVSNNPGFIAFEELPTGEYLDEDKYKLYFDAGWSILVLSQQEVVEDIAALRKQMNDRDAYLTTGMNMLANQQDTHTVTLNELQERVAKLEAAQTELPPLTDTEAVYELGAITDDTATEKTDTEAPKSPNADEESSEIVAEGETPADSEALDTAEPAVADGKTPTERTQDEELSYLITLLDDIIHNTRKYLFWTGYLPEVGPTALRFGAPQHVVNRRNLIPLSNPMGDPLDPNELFAHDSNNLVATDPNAKQASARVRDYEGNIRELSRDEILRMLRGKSADASDVRVNFQVPYQSRPRPIDTPASRTLYTR